MVSFNFSMLGQLTSPLEATPPTPPTPLTPQSIVGANSSQLSTGVGELPFQPPTNQFKGAQVQPRSLENEINMQTLWSLSEMLSNEEEFTLKKSKIIFQYL